MSVLGGYDECKKCEELKAERDRLAEQCIRWEAMYEGMMAERDGYWAERDRLRESARCYRLGVEVWQKDDPDYVEYWWNELCNALDGKDIGEPRDKPPTHPLEAQNTEARRLLRECDATADRRSVTFGGIYYVKLQEDIRAFLGEES